MCRRYITEMNMCLMLHAFSEISARERSAEMFASAVVAQMFIA
jgi:hypothetical protein